MDINNIFSDLPDNLPEEIFETLISCESVKIERIISPKSYKMPDDKWFNEDTDEFVILLKGSAALLFKAKNERVILKPGDYIYIPRNIEHNVESTDKEVQTIWLAVHFK